MILKIYDRIRTRQIEFFNDVRVSLKYDSVASTFRLQYYFDPANLEHKELTCIGHYHICTLEHNNEVLLRVVILSINLKSGAKRSLVSIGGYSLPGVLEDCEIPTSAYPLQTDNLTLRQIVDKVVTPFGLGVVVDSRASSAMEQVIEETEAKNTQSVKSYLAELCSQKNIIISHTPNGSLLFTKAPLTQTPIFTFEKGQLPATEMEFSFNGQALHSDITVFAQSGVELDISESETIKNPYVPYVFRPKIVIQNSNSDEDKPASAKNVLASELRNMQLIITVDRLVLDGKIIRPGKEVLVLNDEIYQYKKGRWFIESVEMTKNAETEEAVLKCVLPEVYNGGDVSYMFAGINLH